MPRLRQRGRWAWQRFCSFGCRCCCCHFIFGGCISSTRRSRLRGFCTACEQLTVLVRAVAECRVRRHRGETSVFRRAALSQHTAISGGQGSRTLCSEAAAAACQQALGQSASLRLARRICWRYGRRSGLRCSCFYCRYWCPHGCEWAASGATKAKSSPQRRCRCSRICIWRWSRERRLCCFCFQ